MPEKEIISYPKVIEFELPCGKKVKMRELTGADQLASFQTFLDKPEKVQKTFEIWELIAQCCEIEGKKIKSYEELLILVNDKDLQILLLAYNNINMPSPEHVKRVTDFFETTSKK